MGPLPWLFKTVAFTCSHCGARQRIPLRRVHVFERFHGLTHGEVLLIACPACGDGLQIPTPYRAHTGEDVRFDPDKPDETLGDALPPDSVDPFAYSFRYTDSRTRQIRRMRLPVLDLIGRFLQHVLPKGFPKIRSYGLLAPSAGPDLERARHLLASAAERASPPRSSPSAGSGDSDSGDSDASDALRVCPRCGRGRRQLIDVIPRPRAPP